MAEEIKNQTVAEDAVKETAVDENVAGHSETDIDASSEHHHHHHHHHHHSGSGHHHHHRRRRHRSSKRKQRKKRILHIVIITVVLVLTALVVAGASLYAMYHQGKDQVVNDTIDMTAPGNVTVGKKGEYVIYNGERYNYNKDIINILFMGIDDSKNSEDSDMGHMADVIDLFAIDKNSGTIHIINVPRDTMTEVSMYSPDGGYIGREKQPIASAFAYGDGAKTSCLNTAEAVSRVFYNLPIKTYISLNLEGIADINDAVGGVDVVSPETIDPFVKDESYHLEGELARYFVQLRSKERDDANLLRNNRQKLYFSAFLKKVIAETKQNISLPLSLYDVAQPYTCTNLNPDRITYLATEFVVNRNMKQSFSNVPVDVVTNGNYAENYVKEKEFYEMFLSIFYTKDKK